MTKITMVATRALNAGGRRILPGEPFTCSPRYGRMWELAKKARPRAPDDSSAFEGEPSTSPAPPTSTSHARTPATPKPEAAAAPPKRARDGKLKDEA